MLERYWRKHADVVRWVGITLAALFAALIMLTVGLSIGESLGYHEAQSDGYAAQYPNETDQRVEKCFDQVDIARAKECAQEEITASRDDQRSEQDLGAQRQMAKWAYWLLLFTVAQSLLGVLGFGALLITIKQGRDANDISREGVRNQSRAYLAVSGVEIEEPDWYQLEIKDVGPKSTLCSTLTLTLANNGETPARFTGFYLAVQWLGSDGMSDQMVAFEKQITFNVHRGVPTQVPLKCRADGGGLANPGELFVLGRIDYEDVFGDEQHERFCYQADTGGSFFELDFPVRLNAYGLDEYMKRVGVSEDDSDPQQQQ